MLFWWCNISWYASNNLPNLQKGKMNNENDNSMPNAYEETKRANQKVEDEEADNEIVESDLEFDGEVVEPDNDPPQKVFHLTSMW